MKTRSIVFSLLLLILLAAGAAVYFLYPRAMPLTGHSGAINATTQVITKGEYLARAGDCVACHTAPGGKVFAGGRSMPTPFGAFYVPNITPDEETGIGEWNPADFYRMLHTGVARNGALMYPVMPFASYTKVTREDSDAIFAYLMTVPPVRQQNRPHELNFPYNNRELLLGWRTLYFRQGEYVAEPKQSAEWNRGAYLVQGLGHCAMCHTAINALG
ncbi:MAG: cytochrome c, partial [Ramlibacter sp.]|nr:cytochrome c [Ramlibacter sp.]